MFHSTHDCLNTFRVKTTNLIINLDNDDWILDDDSQILAHLGFGALLQLPWKSTDGCPENETEVSFFNRELYNIFKLNPTVSPFNACL